MSLRLLAIMVLAATIGSSVPVWAGDDDKTDQEKLRGVWKVTAMTMGGQEVPGEVAKMLSYQFVGAKVTSRGRLVGRGNQFLPAAGTDQFTLILGKPAPLKTLDLKPSVAGRRTIPGIYELEGDTLKLCLNYAGVRPKSMTASGEATALLTLIREKK